MVTGEELSNCPGRPWRWPLLPLTQLGAFINGVDKQEEGLLRWLYAQQRQKDTPDGRAVRWENVNTFHILAFVCSTCSFAITSCLEEVFIHQQHVRILLQLNNKLMFFFLAFYVIDQHKRQYNCDVEGNWHGFHKQICCKSCGLCPYHHCTTWERRFSCLQNNSSSGRDGRPSVNNIQISFYNSSLGTLIIQF